MREWNNIPKFSLITGRNGTGKTQLLNYIKKYGREILTCSINYNEFEDY